MNLASATAVPYHHDGQEVENRIDRQQQRIDQGVMSGQLTEGEYDHLQTRLDRIDASYEHDMEKKGGHLTAKEAQNLNRREDSLSEQIYFDKHNLAHQPGAKTL